MKSPFPGMDPYLEHPSLWPDVHNRLITAVADDLSERVAPRYYVGLERRRPLHGCDRRRHNWWRGGCYAIQNQNGVMINLVGTAQGLSSSSLWTASR